MALEKEQEYKGFTANYWRILRFQIDTRTATTKRGVRVWLVLYKDKVTRLANVDDYIEIRMIWWSGDDLLNLIKKSDRNFMAIIYEQVKKAGEFLEGAIDA